mgnify:CR=1 FL=1
MRKKLMALLLAASMVVGMTACGSNGGSVSKNSAKDVSGKYDETTVDGIKYKKAKDITSDKIELTYYHFDQDETVLLALIIVKLNSCLPSILAKTHELKKLICFTRILTRCCNTTKVDSCD